MIYKAKFLNGTVYIREITDFEYLPNEDMILKIWQDDNCVAEFENFDEICYIQISGSHDRLPVWGWYRKNTFLFKKYFLTF